MKTTWRTAWQGQDIVVYKNDVEVDRLPSTRIKRVVLVHHGCGDSPGDLVRTMVDMGDDTLIFPADTGFAGRVNFEREAFWAQRGCVFWVPESKAPLPWRFRRGSSVFGLVGSVFRRVPASELHDVLERWPLDGPQTWAQRKWRRIARARPFAHRDDAERLRA